MVLVTGANGFLGSYLVRYLLQQGYPVRAIKRPTSDLSLLGDAAEQVEWVTGDVLDIPSLEQAMEGVDKVYHSAAVVTFDPKDLAQLFKVNVEGTSNVVNVALAKGVRKLLFVSSIAAIGKNMKVDRISEATEWEDNKYNMPYGISKYQAEQEVWRGVAEGLDAVVVNPSFILGAGKWSDSSVQVFDKVAKGTPFYPAGSIGMVDVRDVAQVMIQLMESRLSGERYIVNAENRSYQYLMQMIAEKVGTKPPRRALGGILVHLAWIFDGITSKLTGTKRSINRKSVLSLQKAYKYDNSKVKAALDYEFTPVEQVVEATCQKYLESKKEGKAFATLDL